MVSLSLLLNMTYMNLEIGWRKDMIQSKSGIINILIGSLYQTQSRLLQLNLVVQFHYWLTLSQGLHYPESRFYIRRIRLSKHSELLEPLKRIQDIK